MMKACALIAALNKVNKNNLKILANNTKMSLDIPFLLNKPRNLSLVISSRKGRE